MLVEHLGKQKMPPQRAIFVPGHRVPESVRSVRFVAPSKPTDAAALVSRPEQSGRSMIEVWGGNYYGDLEGPMLASRVVDRETEFVFAESEWPVILAERALVVIIREPPARWTIEIDCSFREGEGRIANRRVRIDNFGTACEIPVDRPASQPAPPLTSRAA
jgi:hypothetical protein